MRYVLKTANYIQYFAPENLRQTFEKKSYEVGSVKDGPGVKYLSNMVQQVHYFASKYSNGPSEKNHMK